MKKILFFIALAVTVLAFVPQVQAQTRQQQQELEQIARRSVNGVSAQDRARAIEIMTDVYVAQGMSRQQAAPLAEMAANSMFTTDVAEMSPEDRRRMEEQQRATDQQRTQDLADVRNSQQQQQQLGENAGWPNAAWFRQNGHGSLNLRQPRGTTARHDNNRNIYLTGGNANTVIQDLVNQVERATGAKMELNDGRYLIYYGNQRDLTVTIQQENGAVSIRLGRTAG